MPFLAIPRPSRLLAGLLPLLLLPAPGRAQVGLPLSASPTVAATPTAPASLTVPSGAASLGDELFAEGDWFRAISEYRRQIFATAEPAERARLWLRVGEAYARARRYGDASRIFSRLQTEPGAAAVAGHTCYRLALAWVDGGLGEIARRQLDKCRRDPRAVATVGADRLELAQAAAAFEQRELDRVLQVLAGFETRHPASTFHGVAAAMRTGARDGQALEPYSPTAAGLMSAALPGLGQFYQGRIWDGVQAMAIVGVLGLTTVALVRDELRETDREWLLPIATGTIGAAFYAANVYGAANGARMTSLMQQVRFIEKSRPIWRGALEVPLP